ncbi:MAG: hypothetical protein ABIZ80_02765 [Bryobacteraceae bacterium]
MFHDKAAAQRGIDALLKSGLSMENIHFLTPHSPPEQSAEVPVSAGEQPGMGAAVGSLVGGAVGTAGGFAAGAALASMLIPGVGPILVGGMLGASLLGLGGAAGGAAAGDAIEEKIPGVPRDELFVYEDALRQGRTVVIAEAPDEQAQIIQGILLDAGAETIDAARDKWWIGLRDADKEAYSGDDTMHADSDYRKGFEAAQLPAVRGKTFEEAQGYLTRRYDTAPDNSSFRRGYERGLQYHRSFHESSGALQ